MQWWQDSALPSQKTLICCRHNISAGRTTRILNAPCQQKGETLCFPVNSPFTQTRHALNARLGGNCFQFSANVPLDSWVNALDFGGFNSPWELCNKLQPTTCNFRRALKECMYESNWEEEHYIYKQFTIIIYNIITNRFRNFIVKELEVYQGVSFSTLLITQLDNTLNLCKHF